MLQQKLTSPEAAYIVSSRVARATPAFDDIVEEYRAERRLEAFIERCPNTAYERVHLPTGSRQKFHVSPAAVLDALGRPELCADTFAREWSANKLLGLINYWNHLGRGTWQYIALPN
jgi:hypothetical protein